MVILALCWKSERIFSFFFLLCFWVGSLVCSLNGTKPSIEKACHTRSEMARAACTLMLLCKTSVHVQWLRGHEEHLCIFPGKCWSGLYSRKYRVKSQIGRFGPGLPHIKWDHEQRSAHSYLGDAPRYGHQGWLKFPHWHFPPDTNSLCGNLFWGIRLYFTLFFFSFFFPPGGGGAGGNQQMIGIFVSAKLEN